MLLELYQILLQYSPKTRVYLEGSYILTQCPSSVHGVDGFDKNPSLLVWVRGDTVVFECKAGCSLQDIVEGFKEYGFDFEELLKGSDKVCCRRYPAKRVDGNLAGFHVRVDFRDGGKRIWWEWEKGKKKVNLEELMLYNQDKLKARAPLPYLVICEGEKVVEILTNLGFYAVGLYGSSHRPSREILRCLCEMLDEKGIIYVCPDNDEAGRRAMNYVIENLLELGVFNIKIIEFIGRREGYDFADLISEFDTEEERRNAVYELMENARPIFPELPTLQDLKKVFQDMTWLVSNIIPTGALVLLTGVPKVSKSLFALNLAYAVASGKTFLGEVVSQGSVLYLDFERGRVTYERAKNFLDLKENTNFRLVTSSFISSLSYPLDISHLFVLRSFIKRYNLKLVVIDTLVHFLAPMLKSERALDDYGRLSSPLRELKRLAEETGCSIICIHHESKDIYKGKGGKKMPIQVKPLGSIILSGIADVILSIAKREENLFILTVCGNELPREEIYQFFYGEEGIVWIEQDETKKRLVQRIEEVIGDFLEGEGKFNVREIVDEVLQRFSLEDKNRETVRVLTYKVLEKLVSKGMVERCERGMYRRVVMKLQSSPNQEMIGCSGCNQFVTEMSDGYNSDCNRGRIVTIELQNELQPETKERRGIEENCNFVTEFSAISPGRFNCYQSGFNSGEGVAFVNKLEKGDDFQNVASINWDKVNKEWEEVGRRRWGRNLVRLRKKEGGELTEELTEEEERGVEENFVWLGVLLVCEALGLEGRDRESGKRFFWEKASKDEKFKKDLCDFAFDLWLKRAVYQVKELMTDCSL